METESTPSLTVGLPPLAVYAIATCPRCKRKQRLVEILELFGGKRANLLFQEEAVLRIGQFVRWPSWIMADGKRAEGHSFEKSVTLRPMVLSDQRSAFTRS